MSDEHAHEPSEVTYAEYFHPARPRSLRYRTRVKQSFERHTVKTDGQPNGTNPAYVSWLLSQSMLADANTISRQFSGQGSMWQNPFANPDPRHAVESASVWFTAYPISLITRPGESFLASLGDEELWKAFAAIGINALHTGPVKRAGGLSGWRPTPSVDGHFDRISTEIDPAFGTEAEFRAMCGMATWYGGAIIDDVVPGHTGKGADFRLAEMKHADYPGIYHMVEIEPEDWILLPDVPSGHDSVNLDAASEEALQKAGYIIGRLQRVIFYAEGVKETNWSATAPIVGTDGVERRWVYLHYFKEGQPSINWLDPSFAGMRLVIGDVLHSLADLGSSALRLDANGFLGAERSLDGMPAWSEGHPLSEAANHLIASMVRKVGGFTFQELNLTIDDIRATGEAGADLSYDFVTRPAYQHALATGDTEFLRLCLRTCLDVGVDPASLVHALQNHDELTYELLHWSQGHCDDLFPYHGAEITGGDLGDAVRHDMCRHLTGDAAPYNLVFTTNGIACTTATVISASLGITDLDTIDERRHRPDPLGAPAAGDVQRAAARGLRAVRVGPVRHAHAAPVRGVRAALQRRHPVDQPARARPDGREPEGDEVVGGDAAGPEPVRAAARAARRRDQLRAPTPGHPCRPRALRRGGQPPDRHPGRLAPRHARDGPPARRSRAAGADGAQLRERADRRHGPLRAPRAGQRGHGHVPRHRGCDGGRPVELPRRAPPARGPGAAGDACPVALARGVIGVAVTWPAPVHGTSPVR